MNNLYGKDIVAVETLSVDDIKLIFSKTDEMAVLVSSSGGDDRLKGKIMAALFFEPSTRTFSSFITAMQRLGGGIIPLNGMKNTSIEKGESFEHTIKVFASYADCLVIRHPEPFKPSLASGIVQTPVINAGDGVNEHPTQALFDIYSIMKHFGNISGLTITMVGDLKNGRTVHSLSQLLALVGNKLKLNLVSPLVLKMPQEIKNKMISLGISIFETDNLSDVISESDIIYMTRVQKERFSDQVQYERLKNYYILDQKILKGSKNKMIIMHPLPIAAGEINIELDTDPRSIYLSQQLVNGLYLRMALLDLILRKQ